MFMMSSPYFLYNLDFGQNRGASQLTLSEFRQIFPTNSSSILSDAGHGERPRNHQRRSEHPHKLGPIDGHFFVRGLTIVRSNIRSTWWPTTSEAQPEGNMSASDEFSEMR